MPLNNESTTSSAIELRDGSRVSFAFYNRLEQHVIARTKVLDPACIYTLKQFCGSDYWLGLTNGERRMAGVCVVDMALKDLVPLVPVPWRHEYPKKYRIK